MFSEDVIRALEEAAEVMRRAFEGISHTWEELAKLAQEAQWEIDARKEERKRWGRPPKRLITAYHQPVRKIRPCARSFKRR